MSNVVDEALMKLILAIVGKHIMKIAAYNPGVPKRRENDWEH